MVTSALNARRGQAAVLALIATLAAAALATAPWYAVSAAHQVEVDALAGASPAYRMISVNRPVAGDQPAQDQAALLRAAFDPAGFTTVVGAIASLRVAGWLPAGEDPDQPRSIDGDAAVNLAYRERVCDLVQIDGTCPDAAGQVLIPRSYATRHGIDVGDTVILNRSTTRVGEFRVAGVYQVVDATAPEWGDGELAGRGTAGDSRDTFFTTMASLRSLEHVTYTYDLVADPRVLEDTDLPGVEAMVAGGLAELRTAGYSESYSGLPVLVRRIDADRQNLLWGVGVAVVVLLLLVWFSLAVVLRGTVIEVRRDVGWWRLHGVPAGRGWFVLLGQSLLPVLVGSAAGGAGGAALAIVWFGASPDPAANALAWRLTGALLGLAILGAVVAVVVTQIGTVRSPVRELLQRVPSRGRRLRRSVLDIGVVLLAAVAVVQAVWIGDEGGGVSLLAPPLAVLAVALVAAWVVPPLANRASAAALYRGWLATALATASIARRSGAHRSFALLVVAVALVTAGFMGVDQAGRGQWQRAAVEVGADRVVTVQTIEPARLLAAVRAADPSGQAAMAVVRHTGGPDHPAVLAVDSTRLGVVSGWRDGYGGTPELVESLLRPPAAAPPQISGETLVVRAASRAGMSLRVDMRTVDTGAPVRVAVGPVAGAISSYRTAVPECAPAGCRVVGLELLGEADPDSNTGFRAPEPGAAIDLYQLSGDQGVESFDTDPAGWHPSLEPESLGPVLESTGSGGPAGQRGLRITAAEDEPPLRADHRVFPVAAPLPLPVLAAGWSPPPIGSARLATLPGPEVPIRVVGGASLVPGSGSRAVLADLEYADRVAPFLPAGGVVQVWFAADPPPSIMDELRARGVVPIEEVSLSEERDRLGSEGSAVAVRFQTAIAVLGLLLAAGVLVVLARQERPVWAAEFAALRQQGVPAALVRRVGYGGSGGLLLIAIGIGTLTGLAAGVLAEQLHPGFVDGWRVVPPPGWRPLPVGVAAGCAVAGLGVVTLATAAGRIRGGSDPGRGQGRADRS